MRLKRIFTIAAVAVSLGAGLSVQAQGLITLHTFTNTPDGANPLQVVFANGLFYGSTINGGTNGNGTLFSYNTNSQVFTTIYNFNGATNNGSQPNEVIVSGTTIYGTTFQGGTNGTRGMIYSVQTDGTGFKSLYSFGVAPDGYNPKGALLLAGSTLYGTTTIGGTAGANAAGTIFKINTDGTGYAILHAFTNTPDGSVPYSGLVLGGNTLYGTTSAGGANTRGTIFAIHTDSSGYTNLYSFTNSPDAAYPNAGLVLSAGVLYGVGSVGTNNTGAIFGINTNGTGYRVLYAFSPFGGNTDGAIPKTTLTFSSGYLYGVTASGGTYGGGTLFLINTNGTGFDAIATFTNSIISDPFGSPIRVGGSVWGTANQGTTTTFGALYRVQLPAITTQPQSLTVTNSSSATFSVGAGDDLQMSYKWYFNTTTLLTGQNTNVLTLASATNNNAGAYTVVISDGIATVTSTPAILTVVAPSLPANITNEPQSASVAVSNSVSFTVGAGGSPPLFFQWYFNTNTILTGQTNATLTFSSVTNNQGGYYTVIVTNQFGSSTSTPALLTVISGVKPTITLSPQGLTVVNGTTASFNSAATGSAPLFAAWYFNTTTLVSSGINDTNLVINPATTNQAGNYMVIVTNQFGSATSTPALLTVVVPPAITQQPQNATVVVGNPASFTGLASGTGPVTYSWYFNTNTLVSSGVNDTTFTISHVTTNQAGYYTVIANNSYGSATSTPALLTVPVPPTISQQPQSISVTNGYDAAFTNVASGAAPLYYQWYFNTNTAVADGTNSVLVVPFVTTNRAGYYNVIVSNAVGNATSTPALLTVIQTKPIIFSQPAATTTSLSAPFSFTVVAAGQNPLAYTWYTNLLIPPDAQAGETSATYTNSSAVAKSEAYYIVVITNMLGKATSSPALLTVLSKPVMTLQPTNIVVTNGYPVTLAAAAAGPAPLSFQWYYQTNTLVSGATSNLLTFTNAYSTLAGHYDVRVANSFGTVTSSIAILSVSNIPNLLTYSFDGNSASFVYAEQPSSSSRLWATTNLTAPIPWTVIASTVIGANGLWFVTDTNAAQTNSIRFYRFSTP